MPNEQTKEAVEARAREFVKAVNNCGCEVCEREAMMAADFSLAENAELRKKLEFAQKVIAWANNSLYSSFKAHARKAEAAEAEVEKLRERLKCAKIAMKVMIGRGSNTPWPEVPDNEIEAWLTEAKQRSALNPRAAKGETSGQ